MPSLKQHICTFTLVFTWKKTKWYVNGRKTTGGNKINDNFSHSIKRFFSKFGLLNHTYCFLLICRGGSYWMACINFHKDSWICGRLWKYYCGNLFHRCGTKINKNWLKSLIYLNTLWLKNWFCFKVNQRVYKQMGVLYQCI